MRLAAKAVVSAVVGLFLVGAGIGKAGTAVDMSRAWHAGMSGHVIVTGCAWESSGWYDRGGWRCHGSFVSDDGAVSDLRVTLHQRQDDRPGEPLSAVVPSATARVAYQPDVKDWLWEVVLALAGLVGGVLSCWLAWRSARHLRADLGRPRRG